MSIINDCINYLFRFIKDMLMMFLEILLMLIFLFFVKYIIDMLVENVIKNLEF